MNKVRYGDGDTQFNWIPTQAISGTTPIVSVPIIDMRDMDSIGVQLITTGTITGTWLIEASNDYMGASNGNAYGQVNNGTATGTFTPVTAHFSVAVAGTAIANPSGSATNQYAQTPNGMRCRALRITFTPASGAGNVTALVNAGSWS